MKIIITEKQEKELTKGLFLESINTPTNQTIICVDIQPEYSNAIYFDLQEWCICARCKRIIGIC